MSRWKSGLARRTSSGRGWLSAAKVITSRVTTLLGELAGLGANVLDVVHERMAPRLRVDEVEVLLQVETRGPAHCDEVISQLRQAGYTLLFG